MHWKICIKQKYLRFVFPFSSELFQNVFAWTLWSYLSVSCMKTWFSSRITETGASTAPKVHSQGRFPAEAHSTETVRTWHKIWNSATRLVQLCSRAALYAIPSRINRKWILMHRSKSLRIYRQNKTLPVQKRLAIMIMHIPHSQRARSLSLVLLDDLIQKDRVILFANNNEHMVQNSFLLSLRSK